MAYPDIYHRAKIIATIGPASENRLDELVAAGADLFRINCSHQSGAALHNIVSRVRALEKSVNRVIGIIADLQGPKIRVGQISGDKLTLVSGETLELRVAETVAATCEKSVVLPHSKIFPSLAAGGALLLDDGRIRLRIVSNNGDSVIAQAQNDGILRSRKGVNIPDVSVPLAAMTEKDIEDARTAVDAGVDWLALSFVQKPEDLQRAKEIAAGRAGVIAKIEKPAALTNLDKIIEESGAVMIARGDLGVEMPPEELPRLQRKIVRACWRGRRPVIVATQMLESMISAPTPTRAEASDVSTALYDGADAVMLSAESAAGDYPVESVAMMRRIIQATEKNPDYIQMLEKTALSLPTNPGDAVTAAARIAAQTIAAGAIVTFSKTGTTTLRVSRQRPFNPVLGLTTDIGVARRVTIAWGVRSVLTKDVKNFDEMTDKGVEIARDLGFLQGDEQAVITAGVPFGAPGNTNTIRIA